MTVVRYLGLVALAGQLACTRAESQGGLTLDAKLPVSFAQVSNVVELGGDRVAFTDTRDKLFLSADLKTGKVDTLGTRVDSIRPDSPASQYKFPGWVAHLGGDTVALVDFSAQRTTLWNERGEPLKVLAMTAAAGSTPVLVYDTVGHGYKIDYRAILGGATPGENARPDSIEVIRIHLAQGRVDTVARLASPVYGRAKFGEQEQEAATVFAPNDFFGVLPDGAAWVARGKENRVDWRAPDGRWSIGEPRKFTPVPVTQADRDRVLAQVRQQGAQYGMPQNLTIEYPFAATKPPFDFALSRPNGEVWLQRPRTSEDAPLTYDVYNRQGKWQREVGFPQGSSLAGFGKGGAIFATIREGERRTVGRYVLK
ncbi:MAG TPA: hypothetical protein VEB59_12605 [Gemmatimonadales bacterium]|nr:hypothetical protein [Gemmatimonadales bacterium]